MPSDATQLVAVRRASYSIWVHVVHADCRVIQCFAVATIEVNILIGCEKFESNRRAEYCRFDLADVNLPEWIDSIEYAVSTVDKSKQQTSKLSYSTCLPEFWMLEDSMYLSCTLHFVGGVISRRCRLQCQILLMRMLHACTAHTLSSR